MEIFCTYCSYPKDKTLEDLPAIRRYKSRRIQSVYESSKKLGLPFYILSGFYGLVYSDEIIPYYDHLLVPDEIGTMANKVKQQILDLQITKIVFLINSYYDDSNVYKYASTLLLACELANINLCIVQIKQVD